MTPRALFHPARLARRPVLSTQSDERLVDLVRAGSDPAFETIVERYRRALMRYASRLLPPERAEDVVQQSFVKAYEAILRDGADIALRPWLYRIVHNNALNALRDRGLRHAELDESFDGVERPDQALERAQGLRDVVVAVQALPERQRDAILLRELEGRSYEEIAVALGVTDGAVRQLLNRARHTLRAAAAAVMPAPLLTRVAEADATEPVAARVAELVGVSAGGAIVAKAAATVLVTGAVVGGAAVVPRGGDEPARAADEASEARPAARDSERASSIPDAADPGSSNRDRDLDGVRSGPGDDPRDEDDDRSGRGGDDDEDDRAGPDNSGPGSSGPDNSGPGGGGSDDLTEDNSGPGSSGPDNSGPGSDDGLADDNSGPGSGSTEPVEETAEDNSGPGGGSGTSGSGSEDPLDTTD